MKLQKFTRKIKCDIGGCGKNATLAVLGDRADMRSAIFLCDKCAYELCDALLGCVQPEQPETSGKGSKK